MTSPRQRTGMHSVRTRSFSAAIVVSPSMISPRRKARLTKGRSSSWTTVPIQSAR